MIHPNTRANIRVGIGAIIGIGWIIGALILWGTR
jgi:hypothetical protein